MIIFLYGPDTYRSSHKLSEIKTKYLKVAAGDTDLAILEGKELTADLFRRQVQTLPFLASSRLVIIKNLMLEGKKDAQEGIIEELTQIPKSTVAIFYEAGQPDKRTKLFTVLNQPKQKQEFPLLVDNQLHDFLTNVATEKELKLSNQALDHLIQRVGSDLWQLTNELEKLALYTHATKKPITPDIIDQLTSENLAVNIFTLTDAFGLRKSEWAIRLLSQLDQEESALGTLALIASHYRNLILIADGQKQRMMKNELTKAAGIHPFVYDKGSAQLKNYTPDELRQIYRYLLQLDIAAKQSMIEPQVGLTVLAAALNQKPLKLPDLSRQVMIQ